VTQAGAMANANRVSTPTTALIGLDLMNNGHTAQFLECT